MTSVLEKVWSYKTFSELTPEAAGRAIEDDTLFSTKLPWARSMDPTLVNTLYYPDGQVAVLTVSERKENFSSPLNR